MTKSDAAFTWALLCAILMNVNDTPYMKVLWGFMAAAAIVLSIVERRKK